MRQVLAIFKKDVRHLWPEILVSCLLTIALVLIYPATWRMPTAEVAFWVDRFRTAAGMLGFFAVALIILVPLSWLMIVSRSVQTERLVGSTQFWITRPYEWHKLLAAKFMLMLVCIHIPFVLAQIMLLIEGGFNPLDYPGALCLNFVFVTTLLLPVWALASFTSNFGKLLLVILGILLFIGAIAVVYSYLPAYAKSGGPSPQADVLSMVFLLGGCGTIILTQYFRRKTRRAWMLICSIALLMTLLALVDPDRWLIWEDYKGTNPSHEAAFAYGITPDGRIEAHEVSENGDVELTIPQRLTGLSDGYIVQPIALKAVLVQANGAQWSSQWQSDYRGHLSAYETDSFMRINIPKRVYDRFKATPVTLQLMVIFDQARAYASQRIDLSRSEFSMQDIGICDTHLNGESSLYNTRELNCRTAMKEPQLTHISTYWTEGECTAVPSTDESKYTEAWIGELAPGPGGFGIVPVWKNAVNFGGLFVDRRDDLTPVLRHLCPNSVVTFTSYEKAASGRKAFAIENFHLPSPEAYHSYSSISFEVRR